MSKGLDNVTKWADLFKILGDPTRLKLLATIHYCGKSLPTVTELAEITGVRVATASAALRAMEKTGVVSYSREGRVMRYKLADERIHRLLHEVGAQHQPADDQHRTT